MTALSAPECGTILIIEASQNDAASSIDRSPWSLFLVRAIVLCANTINTYAYRCPASQYNMNATTVQCTFLYGTADAERPFRTDQTRLPLPTQSLEYSLKLYDNVISIQDRVGDYLIRTTAVPASCAQAPKAYRFAPARPAIAEASSRFARYGTREDPAPQALAVALTWVIDARVPDDLMFSITSAALYIVVSKIGSGSVYEHMAARSSDCLDVSKRQTSYDSHHTTVAAQRLAHHHHRRW